MRGKKCIIVHVEEGFLVKVHYSAVFGGRKREEKDFNAAPNPESRIPKFRDRDRDRDREQKRGERLEGDEKM
jgi:hypothetical protein